MELVPGDRLSDVLAFTGCYEERLTRRVIELGRIGGKMIDVGANLGYFSLLWLSSRSSNRCIAFEASPRNIEILQRNLSRNAMAERVQVFPCAASDRSGKVLFDLGPDDERGWGGIVPDSAGDRTIEIDAVRIDEVVSHDEEITLLKIDTEGADSLVLNGCEHLLKRGLVREIWFEQNKPRMKRIGIPLDAGQKYLESVGYSCAPQGNESDELVEWRAVRHLPLG